MNNSTSVTNYRALRSLLSTSCRFFGNNAVFFQDELGHQLWANLRDGCLLRQVGMDVKPCCTEYTSKKSNGYLYVDLFVRTDSGLVKKITVAQHVVIAMIAHGSQFDSLISAGIEPVVNHKDNCPWHNYQGNLEWVSVADNNMHGALIKRLHQLDDNVAYLGRVPACKYIHPGSGLYFDGLGISLGVEIIKTYADAHNKKVRAWSDEQLLDFIDFIDKEVAIC